MEQILVSLIFLVLGVFYVVFPRQYFNFRAWMYKKIFKAKIEGSERVYLMYRLTGIFFLIVAIFMIYSVLQSNELMENERLEDSEVVCIMDAKLCSDGSSVGRVGPNCEFTPCPDEN